MGFGTRARGLEPQVGFRLQPMKNQPDVTECSTDRAQQEKNEP